MPYHHIKTPTIESAMKKSRRPEMTGEIGIKIRGKAAFEITREPMIKLVVEEAIAVWKYVQGTRATNEKIGYGIPSLGIFANRPKTTLNTIMLNTGRRIAHPKPSTVCVYWILTSRTTR